LADNVTNPTVIIEILSPSTMDYDRGTKFNLYRGIKTLKEYILIDSSSVSVELFVRQKDNCWNLTEFKQLSDSFVISTIRLSMNLNDIYEDVRNILKEPALKYNYISPEQYLVVERAAEIKHEYHNGKVITMSGASPAHNDIAYTINRIIAPFLYGKGCKLYGSDFRIHIPENELFTYPDFSIVCGKAETAEIYTDNLTNPAIIIEILSPSTKDYCRGTKFNLYRSIKTLKEYVLIDSKSVSVELFTRQQDNSWNLTEFKQLSDSFAISAIGLLMNVKDIYEDVQFED
jgi:Uma2 family endonuclease